MMVAASSRSRGRKGRGPTSGRLRSKARGRQADAATITADGRPPALRQGRRPSSLQRGGTLGLTCLSTIWNASAQKHHSKRWRWISSWEVRVGVAIPDRDGHELPRSGDPSRGNEPKVKFNECIRKQCLCAKSQNSRRRRRRSGGGQGHDVNPGLIESRAPTTG